MPSYVYCEDNKFSAQRIGAQIFTQVLPLIQQWNPAKPDSFGTKPFVLISGVSSFEGFVCLCQNNLTAASTEFAAED